MKTAPSLRRWTSPASLCGALLCGVGAVCSSCCSPAAAAEYVDVKLVLATDVSGSINNNELWLERTGTAAAFLDPDVIRAIQGGALGRIAVAMLDFSSPGFGKTVTPWRVIRDAASAAAFAKEILALPRTPGDRTSVSNALELGAAAIRSSGKDIAGMRNVIDVTGDGPNNIGKAMTQIRERTIAQGIIVNGLPVMDEAAGGYFPGLDRYYQACVAGGVGAFVIVVHSYKDFASAMRRKLILEISENDAAAEASKHAEDESTRRALMRRVAAAPAPSYIRKPAPTPPIPPSALLRPARNEYSDRCDIPDG